MTVKRGYVAAIAGLRAIAVISIIGYHINRLWIPGGFVGVDIFFVISGFVVAHSVIDTEASSFASYIGLFYKRRFQRILPAAFSYVAIAAVISLIFIPLAQETKFNELTGAAATFGLANVFLWLKTGDYFAASSEMNIFTHMWSLALEEQYYLFFPFFSFPLLINRGSRPRTRMLAFLLVVLASIGSLLAAALLSSRAPTFAFYMLPARFWELGIGFLLRFWLTSASVDTVAKRTQASAPAIAAIALGGVILSLVITDPLRFPFPGALLPCFATLLLIAVVWLHPGVWADRLLSLPLLVWLGNISYSLYLWHWGVIVLMRWTCGIDTLPLQIFALGMTVILGALSYSYIEKTFHNRAGKNQPPSRKLFLGYGLVAAGIAGLCVSSFVSKPYAGLSVADNVDVWNPYWQPPLPAGCPTKLQKRAMGVGSIMNFGATCTVSNAPNLFILGDSHAGAYQRAAWRIAATGRYRVTVLTLGGCRPLLLSKLPHIQGCEDFLKKAEGSIRHAAHPGDVLFLPGLQTTRYRTPAGTALAARPLDTAVMAASRERLRDLASLGAAVVVESAKPVAMSELYRCSDWFNRGNPDCRPTADASLAETWRRVGIASGGVTFVANGLSRVMVWEPKAWLCQQHQCPAFIDGKPLYFDEDHLSGYGNDRLFLPLLKAIDDAHNLPVIPR